MPNYAKKFKDILNKKKKIVKEGIVNLIATCRAVIQRSLPAKMKDPGSFTIPCSIRKYEFKKALCDSGANINLMPLSVVQRLSLGEHTPTTIILQMADRSMAQPKGVLEDVLVKVVKFIFPVDFVVMKMEEDNQVPLLRGRPFLATGVALIDVKKGELTLRVCIDYRKLKIATLKDHFPLPFIDQMLDRLAGHPHFCFLDGYSGYNQIAIAPEDQEKTTFTFPYGTFSFRGMPFELCNAPATFQRCMMSMFSDLA